MQDGLRRREFLTAGAALAGAAAFGAGARPARARQAGGVRGVAPIAIASGNGLAATTKAATMMREGLDPLDAVIEGVRIIEDDPNDMTVGLGGLPNEEGVVELDASVMHGPTHRAGAVASLRNIRNPASVARDVARYTDHVLIVGEGALKFARRMGYAEENLLTERARIEWLRWRGNLGRDDKWLNDDEMDLHPRGDDRGASGASGASGGSGGSGVSGVSGGGVRANEPVMHHTGTVHVSGLNARGDLGGCTSTSGLSWKLPGRVGDSPIIGAGLYTDNDVGSAGATGRGEAVIQIGGARHVVARMEAGDHPTDACLHALRLIAKKTTSPRHLDDKGRPNFNVIFYALRKDGAYGAACMHESRVFAVSDGRGDRTEACAFLYGA